MADYTVLRQSVKENTATVVIEFAVPAGNNAAAVGWQAIVAELRSVAGEAGSTQNPRKVADAPHIAALDAGSVYELVETFEYDANLSDVAKGAALDADVAAKVSDFTNEFAATYRYYGRTATV